LPVIAPWREWNIVSREMRSSTRARTTCDLASTTKIYSRDRNIWHIRTKAARSKTEANAGAGRNLDVDQEPRPGARQARRGDYRLRKGVPVSVDGKSMKASSCSKR